MGVQGPLETHRVEDRVLDALRDCSERWGRARVTVDDVAAEAGVSRATLYRLFPGGRDRMFEALRVRSIAEFFASLTERLAGADGFEDLVVRGLVEASIALHDDVHLQVALASEPGQVVAELTIDGLPRIIDVAIELLSPWFDPYIGPQASARLSEWLSRVVIFYFLVPSQHVDLTDVASATEFTRLFILPAFPLTGTGSTGGTSQP